MKSPQFDYEWVSFDAKNRKKSGILLSEQRRLDYVASELAQSAVRGERAPLEEHTSGSGRTLGIVCMTPHSDHACYATNP